MGKIDAHRLCGDLLHSETEKQAIAVLTQYGLWEDPKSWRYYGDIENNWGQGGNQQSLAEAALAEKIVNSIDARLLNECQVRGIDPRGSDTPRSIREAVARFYDNSTAQKQATGGYVEEWSDTRQREVAQDITLCATGIRPTLNLTVTDCGEGQTPQRLKDTILSLGRSNKMYVPFVQGQFNQGGTGALRFCGEHNLQLVISRRNPALVRPGGHASDSEWGFSIVRRERPAGGRRSSTYTYLAPVGVAEGINEREGEVLSFKADSLPIFPDKTGAYNRAATFGTAIKLFDYRYIGERSNILRGKSVFSRLDLLLPEIALPVRVYEYRSNAQGKILPAGSRETTLLGLRRRLLNTKNVEDHFPVHIPFSCAGEKLIAHVFAFKPTGSLTDAIDDEDEPETETKQRRLGGLRGYRKREGILFTRNGQTQGVLPKDFFRRDTLKLRSIAEDLLVFVDCDQLSDAVREDLFMPSRDRLADIQFKADVIDGLEQCLKRDESLKQLRNRRQQEQLSEQSKDDRPLADVLQTLIKNSPNLMTLLQFGQRITAPFDTRVAGQDQTKEFKGEVYPSFFNLKGADYGKQARRATPINYRVRLAFETDARNDYFTRRIERGQFSLTWSRLSGAVTDASYVGPTLKDGIATVNVTLPADAVEGDRLTFVARTWDSRATFENSVEVLIQPAAETRINKGSGGKRNPPDPKKGGEREVSRQLATPNIQRIYEPKWEHESPPFDGATALRVESAGYDGEDDGTEIYIFKVNMDNNALRNEILQKRLDEQVARNQFLYGNVLIGLSLLLQDRDLTRVHRVDDLDAVALPSVEQRIEMTTRALAPFMLALTSLGTEDLSALSGIDGLEEVG